MKKSTLFIILLFFFLKNYAQNLPTYAFTQSTTAYTEITGGTVLGNSDTDDERFVDLSIPLGGSTTTGIGIPIGFDFLFNGYTYNRFAINANGWISLGSSALTPAVNMSSSSAYFPLSTTTSAVPNDLVARISAFSRDMAGQLGSELRYELSGASPNRVLTIQWKNFRKYGSTGDSFNFQIKLFETTNEVRVVYGAMATQNASNVSTQAGLRAAPNYPANNFNSRVTTSDWTATTASTSASGVLTFSQTLFPPVGLSYSWIPPNLCTGMPNPGNTISDVTLSCYNFPFNLSLQNPTNGAGVTYQWKISTDGVSYSPILNATNSTYQATQTTSNYYKCTVTCTNSNQSSESTPILVNTDLQSNCFCIPQYTYGKTYGDLISNVVIADTTLSNNTGTSPTNPAYTFYQGQPNYTCSLTAGSVYTLTISHSTLGNQNVAVWIDFNSDGVFSIDERVAYSQAPTEVEMPSILSLNISCTATVGIHRMRIRNVWNVDAATIDPCATYNYGESEDYVVTILPAPACSQPNTLFVSSITNSTAVLSWNAGCTETMWDVYVVNQGGATPGNTPTYSNVISPFTINGLQGSTTYDFYVRANCQNNGFSLWTGPYAFTTLPNPPANDNCTTATPLLIGNIFPDHQVFSTNLGATNSNPPNPNCAFFNGADVWYTIVVPSSGNVTIETQGDFSDTVTDTGLAVYSGTCSALSLVSCNDDNPQNGYFSILSLTNRTPGEILYANVWTYNAEEEGTFYVSAYDCTSTTPSPTGASQQYFCAANNPTLQNIIVSGDNIKWYSQATGGVVLANTTVLQNNTTYYASQTINCEGLNRLPVLVTLESSPLVNNTVLTLCDNTGAIGYETFNLSLANNQICNTPNVVFEYYTTLSDAQNGTNAITTPANYVNTSSPQTIYVKVLSSAGCYALATISLQLTQAPSAPQGIANQTFCGSVSLSSLVVTGNAIKWYDSATNGNMLANTTLLVSGTTYYASQEVNGCESITRLSVTVLQDCSSSGCVNAPYGLKPASTFIPSCTGSNQVIISNAFAGEYSQVEVIQGVTYTFSSSLNTDFITISNQDASTVLATGLGTVQWTSNFSGIIRYYLHAGSDCSTNTLERIKRIQCGINSLVPNDDCFGAIMLTPSNTLNCQSVVTGSVQNATPSNVMNNCAGTADDDVWYKFVATSSSYHIVLSNITGSTLDMYHALYTGNCNGLSLVQGSCSDPNSNVVNGLLIGQTYYLRIYTTTSIPNQNTTFSVCILTPPSSSNNDECTTAINLTIGDTFTDYAVSSTNALATNSNAPGIDCADYNGGDLWYTVVIPASGAVTLETGFGSLTDTGMAAYSGNCSNLQYIQCDDDSSPNGKYSMITLTNRTPGEIIYVNVWDFGNDNIGSFQISAYNPVLDNQEFDNLSVLNYYPNPVKDVLYLKNNEIIDSITIYNMIGQEMYNERINNLESEINFQKYPSGNYIIQINCGNKKANYKIIKL